MAELIYCMQCIHCNQCFEIIFGESETYNIRHTYMGCVITLINHIFVEIKWDVFLLVDGKIKNN